MPLQLHKERRWVKLPDNSRIRVDKTVYKVELTLVITSASPGLIHTLKCKCETRANVSYCCRSLRAFTSASSLSFDLGKQKSILCLSRSVCLHSYTLGVHRATPLPSSSKILTHGLGSLKGSPQSEKKKKERALRSDDPAVWSWSPASYQ